MYICTYIYTYIDTYIHIYIYSPNFSHIYPHLSSMQVCIGSIIKFGNLGKFQERFPRIF